MAKQVLKVIDCLNKDIRTMHGVTHDLCMQENESATLQQQLSSQIEFYNSGRSSAGSLENVPPAPKIYQTIFDECEAAGEVTVTQLRGYEIQTAVASTEQQQRISKAADTPENRAFMNELAKYA